MICNNVINSDGMGSKRKALEMITNIFCKKSKDCENINTSIESNSEECLRPTLCQQSLSVPETDFISYNSDVLPKSPISPRVKNIHLDMEALMLSRQDNPYIMQQLERLSTKEIDLSTSAHSSPARSLQRTSLTNLEANPINDNNFIIDDITDTFDDNLHDKLIRSPPPQFPKNLSLFVFPNSSTASVQSYRTGDRRELSPSRLLLSPNFNHCHQSRNMSPNLKTGSLTTSHDNNLDPIPYNYKYERRGSDSSILSNNWKTSFLNQSMAVSSSSLLSFIPRCPALDSQASASNDSNMSCSDYQIPQTERMSGSGVDQLEIFNNFNDNSTNEMNFMSASNSREALLKDLTQDSMS